MSVNVGSAYAELTLNATKFNAGLKSAEAQIASFKAKSEVMSSALKTGGGALTAFGAALTKGVTLPFGAAAAASVKTTMSFDAAMSKVKAISGATGKEFDILRSKAREMGAKTKFSASEAAEAMNYMAMAGWKTKDMLNGIEGVMNLAAASGEDLGTTSDIVTDALTAFGLSAKDSGHFADVMAAAAANANTNVGMLGESFKYVAPLAGAMKFSIEDTSVALGLMANSGIKAGQAGTSMRGWLTRLAKPTKATATAMKELGLNITNSDGSMKSLMQIMQETRKAFSGLSEAQKTQYAATLAGQYGMSGLLAIVNTSEEDFKKLSTSIDGASGSAEKMSETMLGNAQGSLIKLKSATQELMISLGDLLMPAVTDLIAKLQKWVDYLNSLDENQKRLILKFGAIAAAAGSVLMVVGKLVSGVGTIIAKGQAFIGFMSKAATAFSSIGAAGSGITTLGGALGAVATTVGPIVAVGAAIAALVIALKELYDRGGKFKESVDNLTASLSGGLSGAIKSIKEVVTEFLGAVSETWDEIVSHIDFDAIDAAMSNVVTTLQRVFNTLKPFVEFFVEIALVQIRAALESVFTVFSAVFQGIMQALPNIINTFTSAVNIILDLIDIIKGVFIALTTGDFGALKDAVSNLIHDIIDYVKNLIEAVGNFLGGFILGLVNAFVNFNKGMLTKIGQFFSKLWNSIREFFSSLPDKIVKFVKEIPEKIKNLGPNMLKAGKKLMNTLWDGLKGVWGDLKGWFDDKIGGLVDFGKNIGGAFKKLTAGGSHAGGLEYVPYDGYIAQLHEGEKVLTRNEAKQYQEGSGKNFTFNYYSPESIDPYKANKLFKQSVRELEEGFVG